MKIIARDIYISYMCSKDEIPFLLLLLDFWSSYVEARFTEISLVLDIFEVGERVDDYI